MFYFRCFKFSYFHFSFCTSLNKSFSYSVKTRDSSIDNEMVIVKDKLIDNKSQKELDKLMDNKSQIELDYPDDKKNISSVSGRFNVFNSVLSNLHNLLNRQDINNYLLQKEIEQYVFNQFSFYYKNKTNDMIIGINLDMLKPKLHEIIIEE